MGKRIISLFSVVVLLFSLLIIRLYTLAQSDYLLQTAQKQSTYLLPVTQTRGAIYDCNRKRITDTQQNNLITVLPSADSIESVAQQLTGKERNSILEQMKAHRPFAANTGGNPVYSQDIENFTVSRYRNPEKPFAPHILGYLNGEGDGVTGIEAAYNDLLKEAGEKVFVRYAVNAQRIPLEGQVPEIVGNPALPSAGVVLTLDSEIQKIASRAASEALSRPSEEAPDTPVRPKAAVIVMEVGTGKLRAVVSLPEFSPAHLQDSLQDPNTPLFNRAFAGYSVGSTFKLAVAAAALEQGISSGFSVDCVGGVELGGRIFYCHNRAGHRETDMKKAIEQSCNPYFIALGKQTGGAAILSMAEAMGFGTATSFAKGMKSVAGTLPYPSELKNPHELANFSFGQGKFLATPVQVAAMICSIANGGNAVLPSLIEGTTEDGMRVSAPTVYATNRIMSTQTAAILRAFMISTVEEGSGTAGKPEWGAAGGKTASAQTGKLDENGMEIVHAWFAGFFPAEKPQYAVVVMAEGGEYGGKVAGPIFKRIADEINLL